jgi:hypothetical protein
VEEDDVTISEATGQGCSDCRGLGWTMANDLQLGFSHAGSWHVAA